MNRIGVVFAALSLVSSMAAVTAFGEAAEEPKKERAEGRQGVRGGDRGDMGRGGMMMRWMLSEWVIKRIVSEPKNVTDIGLSEEQVKTLKEAVEQAQKQREELQKQLSELEQQQRKLLEEATVDEAAVMALVEKISKIRLEMDKASIKFMLLAKKTLTPEQVNKVKDSVQQFMKNRGEGERGRGEGERRGRGEGERGRGEEKPAEGKGEVEKPAPKAEPLPATPPAVW